MVQLSHLYMTTGKTTSLTYFPSKTMGCFSGHLMSSASDQKLFCEICSAFNCSFDEFVGEKVVSPSYSSAILAPPPKTTSLTRQTFVGKVISQLFNMLSRLIIAFLLMSKHLLISWLQSPSAVILEPLKIKSVTISIISPSIFQEMMGPDAMILVFEC